MGLEEGIIKFRQEYKEGPALGHELLMELDSWRRAFYYLSLIGQYHGKYDNARYGNVSQRLEPFNSEPNKRRFAITGSQTGHLEYLTPGHYAVVAEYYPEQNLVISEGPIKASSESMTHGTIYDLDDEVRFVFHAHSHAMWENARALEIPETSADVEYGTPEMAEEVRKLFRDTDVRKKKILSMEGHEDGIFTFGGTSKVAGMVMTSYLARALEISPIRS